MSGEPLQRTWVSRLPSVVRHAGTYLAGDLALKMLGLISLPVLTRMLSPVEYGTLVVFGSYFTVISVLLTLNTHTAVARYFYEQREDFPAFLKSTLAVTGVTAVASASVLVALREPLAKALGLPGYSLPLLIALTFAMLWSAIYRQVLVSSQRSREASIWPVVRGYLGFALSILLILPLDGDRYHGPMAARVLIEVVLALYFVRKLLQLVGGSVTRDHVRYILGYTLPLIPHSLNSQILGQFDRIVINGAVGAAAAGVYSVGYSVAALMMMVIVPLRTAFTPQFFELQQQSRRQDIDRLNQQFLLAAGTLGVGLIVFGPEIIMLLAPSSYQAATAVIAPVAIGYLFDALSGNYGLYVQHSRRTGLLSANALAAGATNILLNLYFIPRYGAQVAGYTTLASYALSCSLALAVTRLVLRAEPTSPRILLKPLACMVAAAVLVWVLEGSGLTWHMSLAVKALAAGALVWPLLPRTFVQQLLARVWR